MKLGNPKMKLVKSALGDVRFSDAVSNTWLRDFFAMIIKHRNTSGIPLANQLWNNKHAVENWGPSATKHVKETLAYWNSIGGSLSLAIFQFRHFYPAEFSRLEAINKVYSSQSQKNHVESLIQQDRAARAPADVQATVPEASEMTVAGIRVKPAWLIMGGILAAAGIGFAVATMKK